MVHSTHNLPCPCRDSTSVMRRNEADHSTSVNLNCLHHISQHHLHLLVSPSPAPTRPLHPLFEKAEKRQPLLNSFFLWFSVQSDFPPTKFEFLHHHVHVFSTPILTFSDSLSRIVSYPVKLAPSSGQSVRKTLERR